MKKILFFATIILALITLTLTFYHYKFNGIENRLSHIETNQKRFESNFFSFRKSITKDLPFENGTNILFRVHGSNTLGDQLIPQLAKEYLLKLGAIGNVEFNKNPKFPDRILVKAKFKNDEQAYGIDVYAGGSSTAFSHLKSDLCDIGMSSRIIGEKDLIDQPLEQIKEDVIALDGIAIAVHPNNAVRELTIEQVKKIFTGQITNWNQLGGTDKEIHVFKRDNKSGTLAFFKSHIMDSEEFALGAKVIHSQRDMQSAISKDEHAIGFLSLPFLEGLRSISLKATESSIAITPNEFTISSEDYPITRRLYLYTHKELTNNFAVEFLNFSKSDQSHTYIQASGFIPLKVYNTNENQISNSTEELPSDYKDIIASSQRLSVTIKFSQNQSQLDAHSISDVIRLVRTLEKSSTTIKKVYLVGFSDSMGEPQNNLKVSAERADFIKKLILENTTHILSDQIITSGLGSYKPLASNNTPEGRLKNRRVEVWVLSK